jgi:hypothetical protein
MEHRYYPRMPISLKVDLFKRNDRLGHAHTTDISLGGMMLKSDQLVLNRNDVIMIRIWMKGEEHVMRGLVIHASGKQAGVMLIDMSNDVSLTMFNFLKEMSAHRESFK